MKRKHPLIHGIILASVAAGPTFLCSVGLAALYLHLPKPVEFQLEHLNFLVILLPASVLGFVFSLLPNTIGATLMLGAGMRWEPMRWRPIWILVGALLGTAIAWLVGANEEAETVFGFISTSAACAALCRRHAGWDEVLIAPA